jgi:hypothetical protein
VASRFYDIGAKDPETWFAAYEWTDLGDLAGRDVLHLQCHLGTETMAFARRGARTVGLDLSGAAIAEARASPPPRASRSTTARPMCTTPPRRSATGASTSSTPGRARSAICPT